MNRVDDPEFEPDREVVTQVSRLTLRSSRMYPSEDVALSELRKLITGLLGGYTTWPTPPESRDSDGTMFKHEGSCNLPLVLLEYKRAIGKGGVIHLFRQRILFESFSSRTRSVFFRLFCTSILRAFFHITQLTEYLETCGCPSFLTGGGPHLSMLGAIQTDKFIVQNLASLYIGEATTYEDTRVHYLAKVFTSLPRARDTLNQYYERISDQVTITPIAPEDPQGPRVRCFFPYSTEFEEYQARPGTEPQPTEFEYINVPDAHPANVTFFVQVKSSNRKFVTKFVGRYGMEAHELLASERPRTDGRGHQEITQRRIRLRGSATTKHSVFEGKGFPHRFRLGLQERRSAIPPWPLEKCGMASRPSILEDETNQALS